MKTIRIIGAVVVNLFAGITSFTGFFGGGDKDLLAFIFLGPLFILWLLAELGFRIATKEWLNVTWYVVPSICFLMFVKLMIG